MVELTRIVVVVVVRLVVVVVIVVVRLVLVLLAEGSHNVHGEPGAVRGTDGAAAHHLSHMAHDETASNDCVEAHDSELVVLSDSL